MTETQLFFVLKRLQGTKKYCKIKVMKDLHIHTKNSDGEFDEEQILELIKNAGLTEFAICDHDTILGSQKVFELLKKQNSNLIFHTGIELTCKLHSFKNGVKMHILFYDFDFNCPALQKVITKISELRQTRIEQMVKFIQQELKITIPQKMISDELKQTNSFGKPHLFNIISKLCDCSRQTFFKIMDKLDSSEFKLDAEETIQTLSPFGIIGIAHPVEIMKEYNFGINDIEEIILHLKKFGLNALETHHSAHTKQLQAQLTTLAQKHGLLETMGSDFHGPESKPDVVLGQIKKE